jgi:methyl-accepting chemotaxis protein
MPDFSSEFHDGARQAAYGFTRASKGLRFANEQLNVAYQGLTRMTTAAQMTDSMDPVRDELAKMAHLAENLAEVVRGLAGEVQNLANNARGLRDRGAGDPGVPGEE